MKSRRLRAAITSSGQLGCWARLVPSDFCYSSTQCGQPPDVCMNCTDRFQSGGKSPTSGIGSDLSCSLVIFANNSGECSTSLNDTSLNDTSCSICNNTPGPAGCTSLELPNVMYAWTARTGFNQGRRSSTSQMLPHAAPVTTHQVLPAQSCTSSELLNERDSSHCLPNIRMGFVCHQGICPRLPHC